MKMKRVKKALTGQGAGHGTKRAQEMAYGKAGPAKRAMRHESECMMKHEELMDMVTKL